MFIISNHPRAAWGADWAVFVAALLLAGCGLREPAWRTYEETDSVDPQSMEASSSEPAETVSAAVRSAPLHWSTPKGWSEEAGSGMRLASFSVQRGERAGACTLITLRGTAGGLEANVLRWIGQLNAPEPSKNEFAAFLDRQARIRCEGGFEGVLVDLTELGGQAAEPSSMIAAVITLADSTLFLKFTGPPGLLKEEKASFTALCRSLRTGP